MNLLSLVRSWQDNNYHKQTKSTTVYYNVRFNIFFKNFVDLNTPREEQEQGFRPGHAKKVQWLTYSSIHPSQQGTPTPGRRGEKVCVAFSRDVTVNGLFAGSPLACHWCLPCAVYIHDTHADRGAGGCRAVVERERVDSSSRFPLQMSD